jgi:hypothetical protein
MRERIDGNDLRLFAGQDPRKRERVLASVQPVDTNNYLAEHVLDLQLE